MIAAPTSTKVVYMKQASVQQKPVNNPKTELQAFYEDHPEMRKIAECESGGTQSARNKNYRNGRHWSTDVGYFQINNHHWGRKAKELGYDIYTKEGNIKMARYILENYGIHHWVCS